MTKIVQLVNTCRECPNRHYYSAGTYECEKVQPSRLNADMSIPGWCPLPNYPAGPDMSPEFTDTARAALMWVLWHHQGGSSPTGQAVRFALGMGQFDRLTADQVAQAKTWAPGIPGLAHTDAAGVTEAQAVRKCFYCEREMLAGSECTSASQSTDCAMRDGVTRLDPNQPKEN